MLEYNWIINVNTWEPFPYKDVVYLVIFIYCRGTVLAEVTFVRRRQLPGNR